MAKNTAIYSVTNTINKLYIQSDLILIFKQNFYNYKQKEIHELFEYHVALIYDLDHPTLIEE